MKRLVCEEVVCGDGTVYRTTRPIKRSATVALDAERIELLEAQVGLHVIDDLRQASVQPRLGMRPCVRVTLSAGGGCPAGQVLVYDVARVTFREREVKDDQPF